MSLYFNIISVFVTHMGAALFDRSLFRLLPQLRKMIHCSAFAYLHIYIIIYLIILSRYGKSLEFFDWRSIVWSSLNRFLGYYFTFINGQRVKLNFWCIPDFAKVIEFLSTVDHRKKFSKNFKKKKKENNL